MKKKIIASIVIYGKYLAVTKETVKKLLEFDIKVFIIDNSPVKVIKDNELDDRVSYIHCCENLGYGKAHNIAINESISNKYDYHIVINPDINLDKHFSLEKIVSYMEANEGVGLLMPKIIYPDGQTQYLCKLISTPFDLFLRRFIPVKRIRDRLNERYELRFTNYSKIMNIPNLSGCFMFLRVKALENVKGFDPRFFMYMEDLDLTRRIGQSYETIYFPETVVIHEYAKSSYKFNKLFFIHIKSAIAYFNKWGWFNDPQRKKINRNTVSRYMV